MDSWSSQEESVQQTMINEERQEGTDNCKISFEDNDWDFVNLSELLLLLCYVREAIGY